MNPVLLVPLRYPPYGVSSGVHRFSHVMTVDDDPPPATRRRVHTWIERAMMDRAVWVFHPSGASDARPDRPR